MFGPAPVFSLGILFHSFRFLDSAGRATCTPSTSADFSPLIFCGSVAGRLHTGERKEIVTRNSGGVLRHFVVKLSQYR